jgi:isocitrate/isopropylmalate dehydrogenase
MESHRIAVMPGDGIGKEVVPEGLRGSRPRRASTRSASNGASSAGTATITRNTGA